MRHLLVLSPLLAVALLVTARQVEAPAAQSAQTRPKLVRFSSCASLLSYSRHHALNTMGVGRPVAMPEAREDTAAVAPTAQAAPAPAAGAAPSDAFSQTNVQEAGV